MSADDNTLLPSAPYLNHYRSKVEKGQPPLHEKDNQFLSQSQDEIKIRDEIFKVAVVRWPTYRLDADLFLCSAIVCCISERQLLFSPLYCRTDQIMKCRK